MYAVPRPCDWLRYGRKVPFPFVIGTLEEMFGEIGCLCTTRDQNWTRDAPVAMIQCDGRCVLWRKWFESLSVCRRFENGKWF